MVRRRHPPQTLNTLLLLFLPNPRLLLNLPCFLNLRSEHKRYVCSVAVKRLRSGVSRFLCDHTVCLCLRAVRLGLLHVHVHEQADASRLRDVWRGAARGLRGAQHLPARPAGGSSNSAGAAGRVAVRAGNVIALVRARRGSHARLTPVLSKLCLHHLSIHLSSS